MAKLLKPGQLCTINGKVYRCSKRMFSPCSACHSYYGIGDKTPCKYWTSNDILQCIMRFGDSINQQEASFPILVSMCKK